MSANYFTVVIDGSPFALGINHAKKPAIVRGQARLVDTGSSKKAKKAAAESVWLAARQQAEAAAAVTKAATLVVEIDSYWPQQRHLERAEELANGDVDGPLKFTIDALEKSGLIDDDVRVIKVTARKFIDRKRPRIEMRVRPATAKEVERDARADVPRPSVTKLWILLALSKSELVHGTGFAGPLEGGDVAAGKALASAGLVKLTRRPAPAHGTEATLTDDGRAFVAGLIEVES